MDVGPRGEDRKDPDGCSDAIAAVQQNQMVSLRIRRHSKVKIFVGPWVACYTAVGNHDII